jgi:hypothetical protein
MQAG